MKTCSCHGEPMRWSKNANRKSGGDWVCIVKRRITEARYDATDKGRKRRDRHETGPVRKLSKQLNELTRVRVRY